MQVLGHARLPAQHPGHLLPGGPALLHRGLHARGEGEIAEAVERDPVEAGHREVFGDTESEFLRGTDHADGEQVALREHGGRPGGGIGQQHPPDEDALVDEASGGRDRRGVGEDLTHPGETVDRHVDGRVRQPLRRDEGALALRVQREGDERDVLMTEVAHVTGDVRGGGDVVQRDARHIEPRIALDDDDRETASEHDLQGRAGAPGASDEHRGVDGSARDGRAVLARLVAHEEDPGAEVGQAVGEAVHHRGRDRIEERRAQMSLQDHRHDAAAPAPEGGGAGIGAGVAEVGRGGEHPVPGGGCDLGLAAEDDGRGRGGDPRLASHIGDRGPSRRLLVILRG